MDGEQPATRDGAQTEAREMSWRFWRRTERHRHDWVGLDGDVERENRTVSGVRLYRCRFNHAFICAECGQRKTDVGEWLHWHPAEKHRAEDLC